MSQFQTPALVQDCSRGTCRSSNLLGKHMTLGVGTCRVAHVARKIIDRTQEQSLKVTWISVKLEALA